MSDKPKVFVSYARKDEILATAMVAYFELNDIECFIDKRDILIGSKYGEEIIKGIEKSDMVVIILTNSSNTSENVRNEMDSASNLKKKIIVFRVENIPLSKGLQFYLSTSQWFDAFLYRGEQYFAQLADLVKGLPISPFSASVIKQRKITLRILQVYASVSIILFVIFGIPILKDYAFINTKNPRGVRFVDAIKSSGLTDIESKKSGKVYNIAPPTDLYINAKREIFISGVTLRTTLEQHRVYLQEALNRGVKIRLLLLHPQSSDSSILMNINNRKQSYQYSIQNSISIIENDTAMFKSKNVEVRFAKTIPPLIGILIDGDIANDRMPIDKDGIIRVNPYFKSLLHNDWFLQFFKSKNNDINAFDDFAAEYRYYWKQAELYEDVIK